MCSTVASMSSRSASARKPTWPRLTPSSGAPVPRDTSAPRRMVPSPPSTQTSSQPSARGVAVVDQRDARVLGQLDRGGLVALDDHLDAGGVQALDHLGRDVLGLLAARVGHEQDLAALRGTPWAHGALPTMVSVTVR